MKRTNALAIALAGVLMASAANAQRLPLKLEAPRNQDVQAPRDRQDDIQAPRDRQEEIQAPRGLDVQSAHGQDLRAPRR